MPSRNTIEIVIKGEDLASNVLDQISKNLSENLTKIADNFIGAGRSITAITAPVTAALTTAVVQAGKFEEAMYNAGSILGASQDQIAALSDEILAMGTKSRAGPQAVAESYYDIVSGVADATSHMAILDAAIATSEAGNANLMGTTSALVAVMNSYKFGAEDAGFASDVMTGIVQRGVLTMDELAASLPLVTGTANAMGISFDELGGQFAYLTTQGYSASTSASLLNNMMATLMNPTADLATVIGDLGYESGQAMVDALGLAGAYEAIGNFSGFEGIITGQEALRGAIALTGEGADDFLTNFVGKMTDAQQATYDMILATEGLGAANTYLEGLGLGFEGATAAAREIQNMTLAAQFDLIRAAVSGLWIEIGTALIPMMKEITPVILEVVLGLTDWVRENGDIIRTIAKVAAVGTILGSSLVGIGLGIKIALPILGLMGTALGFLLSPIGLVIAGAAALYVAWQQNFMGIQEIVADVVDTVGPQITGFIDRVRETIEAFSLDDFVGRVREGFGELRTIAADVIGAVDGAVGDQLQSAFDRVREIFESIDLSGFIESIGGMSTMLRMLGGVLLSIVFPPLGLVLRIIGLVQLGMKVWQDGTDKTAKNIGKAFDKIGDVLGDFAETALDALGDMAGAFVDWIKPQIPIVLAALEEIALGVVAWVGQVIPQLIVALAGWASAFLDWLGPVAAELLPQLGTLIGSAIQWILGTGVPMLVGATLALGAVLVGWIIDIAPDVLPALGQLLESMVDFIILAAPAFLEAVVSIIEGFTAGLLEMVGGIGALITDQIIPAVKEALSGVTWADVGDFLGRMWEAIKGGAIDAATWVGEKIVTPIIDDIKATDWGLLLGDLLSLVWTSLAAATVFAINAAAWMDQHIILPLMNDLRETDWGLLLGDLLSLVWTSLIAASTFVLDAHVWVYNKIISPLLGEILHTNWGALLGDLLSLIWNSIVAVAEFHIDAVGWIATNIVDPLMTAINGALPSIYEAGSKLLMSLGDGITSAAGAVEQAFKNAVNALIPDEVGITVGRVTLPGVGEVYGGGFVGIRLPDPFAGGGLFGRGQYMMTGELGPELGISRTSGMIVGNSQLQSAMSMLAGGVENVAALLQSPSEMGMSFGPIDGGTGGMMEGDTYYVTVQVDPSLLRDDDKVERNAESFADALVARLRTT